MKKTLLFFLVSSLLFSQNGIFLDEKFSDWDAISNYYVDPTGDNQIGEIDLKIMWVSNDEDYIYFRIQTTKEITLVNNNYLTIYIDSDNDSSTGKLLDNLGAELEYTLGRRSGNVYLSEERVINTRDIGFFGAPTFNGNEFEFGIRRDSKIDGQSLFPSEKIKFKLIAYTSSALSANSDISPDIGGFEYQFGQNLTEQVPTYSIEKQNQEHLRVMAYNVERDGITSVDKTTEYNHIFNAIKPDIIGLTEVYESSSQQIADRISFFLPPNQNEQWFHKKEGEYDIVLVSKYKIKESFTINSEVGHAASGAFLLDLRPAFETDMLVIVSHPKCCSGVQEDLKRQNQFDAIIAFIRNAVGEGGALSVADKTPLLIMGDMNLVGDSRQYQTLITGDIKFNEVYGEDFVPDWDSTGLDDAIPYVTNTGMTYTTNPGSFPPGRLDFIVYSASVLEKVNSFVFDTNQLTLEQLANFVINKSDTEVSDHLPVVADFNISSITNVKKKVKK